MAAMTPLGWDSVAKCLEDVRAKVPHLLIELRSLKDIKVCSMSLRTLGCHGSSDLQNRT